jgi:beta-lactamase superfamily II metal-dependent hydrolase
MEMNKNVARLWKVLVLTLGIAYALSTSAAEVYVLALTGDGSASVTIDKGAKTAYITDGGRPGKGGLSKALIHGVLVLDYLNQNDIENLVVTCSHPHLDHMGGVQEFISSDARITQFKSVLFVDSNHLEGKPSLYQIFQQSWPQAASDTERFKYASADGTNAFEKFVANLSGRTANVSNFAYESNTVGTDTHDHSVVTQYAFDRADGNGTVFVDFDDASTNLVQKWSEQKGARLNVVMVPHHGSRNNNLAAVLAKRDALGLKSAVIAVNRWNRFLHPDADVLDSLVTQLGPDNVFITDSDLGDNIVVDDNGARTSNGGSARERLAAFIAAQNQAHQARVERILERRGVKVTPGMTDVPQNGGFEEKTEDVRQRFMRAGLSTRDAGDVARSLVSLDWHARTEQRIGEKAGAKENREWLAGLPGQFRGSPDATPPSPEPDIPGPLPGGSGGAEFRSKYNESSTGRDGGTGGGGARPRGGGGGAYFRSMLTSRIPVWGGVIVGNEVVGPRPGQLEFNETETDANTEDGDVDAPTRHKEILIVATTDTGEIGYYGPVTESELWSAYNFVSPTPELQQRAGWQVPENAVGVVGMTHNDQAKGLWTFAVHPALADTLIGWYAMRLDMALTAATESAEKGRKLPAAFAATDWSQMSFETYQWYDDPSSVVFDAGQVSVRAKHRLPNCLIRARLVDQDLTTVPQWMRDEKSFEQELKLRVFTRLRSDTGSLTADSLAIQRRMEALLPVVAREMQREAQSAQKNAITQKSLPLNTVSRLCAGYDAYKNINRFAKLVALFNWYRAGGGSLPPLPNGAAPDYVQAGNHQTLDRSLAAPIPAPLKSATP